MPDGSELQQNSSGDDVSDERSGRATAGVAKGKKTLFIESIPLTVRAKDAQAMCVEAGYANTSLSTVYTVRSNAKLRAERGPGFKHNAPTSVPGPRVDLKHGDKRAFVESFSNEFTPMQIVAAAATKGISMTAAYVAQLRLRERRRAELEAARAAIKARPAAAVGAPRMRTRPAEPLDSDGDGSADKLTRLKSLILDVGLDKARKAFAEFDALSSHIAPPKERAPW